MNVGGVITIGNFKKDFTLNGEVIAVEFMTMNVLQKQLYQVYLPYNGNRIRIHMQINDNGDFKIKGKGVCPEKFLPLEAEFDLAIKNY